MKRTIEYTYLQNAATNTKTDLWRARLKEGHKLLNTIEREYPTSWTVNEIINDLSCFVVQNIGL